MLCRTRGTLNRFAPCIYKVEIYKFGTKIAAPNMQMTMAVVPALPENVAYAETEGLLVGPK